MSNATPRTPMSIIEAKRYKWRHEPCAVRRPPAQSTGPGTAKALCSNLLRLWTLRGRLTSPDLSPGSTHSSLKPSSTSVPINNITPGIRAIIRPLGQNGSALGDYIILSGLMCLFPTCFAVASDGVSGHINNRQSLEMFCLRFIRTLFCSLSSHSKNFIDVSPTASKARMDAIQMKLAAGRWRAVQ